MTEVKIGIARAQADIFPECLPKTSKRFLQGSRRRRFPSEQSEPLFADDNLPALRLLHRSDQSLLPVTDRLMEWDTICASFSNNNKKHLKVSFIWSVLYLHFLCCLPSTWICLPFSACPVSTISRENCQSTANFSCSFDGALPYALSPLHMTPTGKTHPRSITRQKGRPSRLKYRRITFSNGRQL